MGENVISVLKGRLQAGWMHRGVDMASVQADVWQLHWPLVLALPLVGPTETTILSKAKPFLQFIGLVDRSDSPRDLLGSLSVYRR